ncbi:SIMPL domain-containing protein [Maritimibacter sp. 55A14]|uniref:SIMPL domain-containing protein n=1 Tax=Maritimibacter sp. 55A14 TaxID=2174844 RepID=UPI000D622B09|nr:SIMPL domain-containing protein [Maritimibacter sp. 55A14]PWE30494.1 SIMPL domain-containing protein [Maritimibacter sp. 55A14]
MYRFIALVLASVLLAGAAKAADPAPRLTVQGTGTVTRSPDIAHVSIGVVAEAERAEEALAANSRRMEAALAALEAAGVARADIRTSAIDLSPRWTRPRNGEDEPPRIAGFTASNMVEVRVRQLDSLGKVLDAVVRAGANRVQSIRFGLDDPTAAEDAARRAAVADAQRKAALYAEAAGVSLGGVIELSETGGAQPPQPMFEAAMARDTSSVPVAEGELTVRAEVRMIFGLDQ